jgi:cytochrome c-type biogenesis protein
MSISEVSWFLAFLAGAASFLSPCVLPLVPGYIALVSGVSVEALAEPGAKVAGRTLRGSVLFVAGFSLVFSLLGAFAAGLASPLAAHLPVLRKVAGLVVALFALHQMRILPIGLLYRQKSFELSRVPAGSVGPLLVGMAFAFGWTPCVGPILASVLTLAATDGSVGRGIALLFAYSLGIGVPFVLTGLGVGGLLRWIRRYGKFARAIELGSGVLLLAVAVLIFTNHLGALAAPFPWLDRFAR